MSMLERRMSWYNGDSVRRGNRVSGDDIVRSFKVGLPTFGISEKGKGSDYRQGSREMTKIVFIVFDV